MLGLRCARGRGYLLTLRWVQAIRVGTAVQLGHGPGPPGRLSALSVSLCKSVFYGAFVWARRALNNQKRRFLARAVDDADTVRAVQGQLSAISVFLIKPILYGTFV